MKLAERPRLRRGFFRFMIYISSPPEFLWFLARAQRFLRGNYPA